MFAHFRAVMANHFMRCLALALLTLVMAAAVAVAALVAAALTLCKAASSFAALF